MATKPIGPCRGTPAAAPLGAVPECPDFLRPEAVAIWNVIVPQLASTVALNAADAGALAAYCETYAQYKQVAGVVQEYGPVVSVDGKLKQNPAMGLQDKLLVHIRAFAKAFGITPQARGRIEGANSNTKKDDELNVFIG
jgi:P27 family predicted phage terminase small subunit